MLNLYIPWSLDMQQCPWVPAVSPDKSVHSPKCGECACLVRSLSYFYTGLTGDCSLTSITCVSQPGRMQADLRVWNTVDSTILVYIDAMHVEVRSGIFGGK